MDDTIRTALRRYLDARTGEADDGTALRLADALASAVVAGEDR